SAVVRFSMYHTMLLNPGAHRVIRSVADDMPEVFSRDETGRVGQKLEFGPVFRGQTQAVNFGLSHVRTPCSWRRLSNGIILRRTGIRGIRMKGEPYCSSKPKSVNFSVRQFSVTSRTSLSLAPLGRWA